MQPHTNTLLFTVGLCALFVSGCQVFTGASYHTGVASLSADAVKKGFTGDDRAFDATVLTHDITIFSNAGVFTAAAGSAGNAYQARQAALGRAQDKANRGDFSKTEYSYEVMGPTPGLNDYFRLRIGSGSGLDFVNKEGIKGQDNKAEVELIGFDVGNYFPWTTIGEDISVGIYLNTIANFWSLKNPADGFGELDTFTLYMPLGVPLTYWIDPSLNVSLVPEIDVILGLALGLIKLLDDTLVPSALQYGLRGKVSWNPFVDFLQIELDAGLESSLVDIAQESTTLSAKVGAILVW